MGLFCVIFYASFCLMWEDLVWQHFRFWLEARDEWNKPSPTTNHLLVHANKPSPSSSCYHVFEVQMTLFCLIQIQRGMGLFCFIFFTSCAKTFSLLARRLGMSRINPPQPQTLFFILLHLSSSSSFFFLFYRLCGSVLVHLHQCRLRLPDPLTHFKNGLDMDWASTNRHL